MTVQTDHPTAGDGTPESTAPDSAAPSGIRRIAMVGNPNTGKTTLFARLCGVRAKTANFPGSTVDARTGVTSSGSTPIEIIDLPGHYGLNLDRPESRLSRDLLAGKVEGVARPDAVVIVVDATNLVRNLIFVSQALQQGLPAVVALNMIDLAQQRGLTIDVRRLSEHLRCPVVPVCARSGQGLDRLTAAMAQPTFSDATLPSPTVAQDAWEWANSVVEGSVGGSGAVGGEADTLTDRLDAAFTHPVLGVIVFTAVMTALFYTIFTLATVPMDLIDIVFAHLGAAAGSVLPPGAIHDLVVDGMIAGIAGTIVFLPQICLLFFLISLLEDTGYLARAAFVMDRLLRRFGLPGQSFVPLLSAHACAIPAIMSARLIPDHRDRLATILVVPFMSCSARLPVYVLLIGILFDDDQWLLAGLAFAGCYILGAIVAFLSALLARGTVLRGAALPMVLELPSYKLPSIRAALLTTIDRAGLFLRKAGTLIVAVCVVLWWLGAYPIVEPPAEAAELRQAAAAAVDPDAAADLTELADAVEARHAKAQSFIGTLGRGVQPAFEPLGYDWQLTVSVLSSLIAREVFVSTMAVVVTGRDEDDESVRRSITEARRTDETPIFTTATSASLLVFYVLAMQCLPTLAITRRETGSWKWAALQFGYMSGVAYVAALATYHGLGFMGVA
jgi:ferrous iron transport protein B